jgi:hypothetical protein
MAMDKDLEKALEWITTYAERGVREQNQTQKDNVRDSLDLVRARLSGDRPETDQRSSIQGFFQAIGDGLKAAQESLDAQSLHYIHNRPAFAPETMFRVPKVSANLKLGMTKSSERGFDFIIIDKSEESQVVEQEISFDIVAAPPPPDALQAIQDLPLGQVIASNPVDRDLAESRLKNELRKQKKIVSDGTESNARIDLASRFAAVAGKMVVEDRFRHVLVHRNGQGLILIYVPPGSEIDPDTTFEFGFLFMPVEETPDIEVDASGLARTDRRNRLLMEILVTIADRQAELLERLGRT